MLRKQVIHNLLPSSIRNAVRFHRSRKQLVGSGRVACDAENLAPASTVNPWDLLNAPGLNEEWDKAQERLKPTGVGGLGGVNAGDRRAIFHLIRELAPGTVLEVGTHIGSSTAHIAVALSMAHEGRGDDAGQDHSAERVPKLVTVDIMDVNDSTSRPWEDFGSTYSPREMMRMLGCEQWTKFVNRSSIDYLNDTDERFDFIFLDGDHSAGTVYREVPAALTRLNPGGVVLLHDFFPDAKPLWRNKIVEPGPALALQRLIEEGADLKPVPLGELPWPTKLGSRYTSLALLLRRD